MPAEDFNYFNYYTEIEEHFRAARGSGLFLLSPLDWALVEAWKEQGIPLEAVLRGIDRAFEKWRQRKSKTQQVNSIAYCVQAVMEEARRADNPRDEKEISAPFSPEELSRHLEAAAGKLPEAYQEVVASLRKLAGEAEAWVNRLEELEQHLSALEQKMVAIARAAQPEEDLLKARQQLDAQLKAYRGKMTAPELMLIERKFLDQRLLEDAGLPRLSLFYLG